MADHSYYEAEIEEEEGGDLQEGPPSKEKIVFLIDASLPMRMKADLEKLTGFANESSRLQLAIQVAREVYKLHVITSASDQFSVVFYGTREKRNGLGSEDIYTHEEMDEPSAQAIRGLDELADSTTFDKKIGSASGRSPEHLRNALWAASDILKIGQASDKSAKRVLIFTDDADPSSGSANDRSRIKARAETMQEAQIDIELFPLVSGEAEFDMSFWNDIVSVKEGGEATSFAEDDAVYKLTSLWDALKHKAYKKRASTRLYWQFPGGFQLAVAAYNLLQPASKPSAVWVEDHSHELLRSEFALVDQDTGAVVTETLKKVFPKPPKEGSTDEAPRLPPTILTQEDVRALKYVQLPGLRLLGFKPLECLKAHHQHRTATFLYPDELVLKGSTCAFTAIHQAMLDAGHLAVCSLARNKVAEARLVALVAAQEVLDENGVQIEPPGMHMIYLPFADDMRFPEKDPSFVGEHHQHANEDQIQAAEALIDALALEDFNVGQTPNPGLQRHYEVLEALALNEDIPPNDPERDQTCVDTNGIQERAGQLIDKFRELVYGGEFNELALGEKKPAVKRKAEVGADVLEAVSQVDYKGLAHNNKLTTLTKKSLEDYCVAHGLPKSGAKAALAARISDHIN